MLHLPMHEIICQKCSKSIERYDVSQSPSSLIIKVFCHNEEDSMEWMYQDLVGVLDIRGYQAFANKENANDPL